ncbi:MAG: hypothetical protein KY476_14135 [Planctomycetes bacterium]|nr:hypothetical protein [Planctomycetota bacterium]
MAELLGALLEPVFYVLFYLTGKLLVFILTCGAVKTEFASFDSKDPAYSKWWRPLYRREGQLYLRADATSLLGAAVTIGFAVHLLFST